MYREFQSGQVFVLRCPNLPDARRHPAYKHRSSDSGRRIDRWTCRISTAVFQTPLPSRIVAQQSQPDNGRDSTNPFDRRRNIVCHRATIPVEKLIHQLRLPHIRGDQGIRPDRSRRPKVQPHPKAYLDGSTSSTPNECHRDSGGVRNRNRCR